MPTTSKSGPRHGRLLRKYAIILAALVAGSLVVSGAIQIWFAYGENREALGRIQREKANAAAAAIAQYIDNIEGQLGWTTHLGAFAAPDGAEQRRFDFIRLLRQAPPITELAYIDGAGKEQLRISRVAMDVVGSNLDRSAEPAFFEARAEGFWRGPVYFHRESEPYMTIAAAERGARGGVTVAEVNLKFIWDVVSAIEVGRTGRAYVVDAQGRLIAHPDISLVLRRTDLARLPQIAAVLASTSTGDALTATDPEGRQALSTHASIPSLGWSVFVELPVQEAYRPLYASMLRTVALVLAGVVLAVLAGLLLARRMTGPIQQLQEGAARIGSGDLTERIEIDTGDELETLAGEFNRMAGRLHESHTMLEQRIVERTAELRLALDRLQALSDVGNTVNSSLDLETVLRRILAHACTLADAGGAAIYIADDEAEGGFRIAAVHGMEDQLVRAIKGLSDRLGETVVGRCARSRDAVQIADLTREPNYPLHSAMLQAGILALLGVPLMREGEVIGALVFRRKRVGPFDEDMVELVKSFAAQSSLAVHNARLFHELERKSRQLEVASEHKSQFLANMSHELRTPLNAILGFTELIQDGIYGEPPGKIRGVLERVEANSRHLLGLINDVLDLSKIEAGQLQLSLGDYAMRDIVLAVINATESLASAKQLSLTADLPPNLPLAKGDAKRLTQVLLNLVGNAIKFTDEGSVRIRVTPRDEDLLIAVEDTGPGIPASERRRIFEVFHQMDSSSTREKGGSGLGLAIAQRIVELHGGHIWVEAREGGGSRFCFSLPLRVEESRAA